MAINTEVDKLLKSGFIEEANYPDWIANVVLVKKANGNWRVCVDFTDLNRACPKDSFPLPRIDQLVDATAGHELLSFMDAYSGYNQIRMHEEDQEHTTFLTNQGLYCYKIGKTMEVYVDDMLVKSSKTEEHIQNLKETFEILRRYKMKLNPSKCAFGVSSGKFLEFMRLTGRIAALNRFISRVTDRCKPFFQALRKGKDFIWTADCEQSFQELKSYLGKPPLLSKPHEGDSLILYLAISKGAVSSALVREEDGVQWPIYYTSKSLLDAETRYPEIEKLALALMPRTAIKGQALADFIAEFTYTPEMSEKNTTQTQTSQWKLYVDGSSTETSSGAGIILVSPDGVKLSCAVRFKFKATNNQAEYEALLSGLRLAKEVSARHLTIYSDSQLIVSQVNSEFQAKGDKMASYLEKIQVSLLFPRQRQVVQERVLITKPLMLRRKSGKCQRFSAIPRQAPEDLTTVTSPWPFAKWGIDLIDPLPTARRQLKYAVVAIDYYTKWVEAEALAKITEQNVTTFIWKNIVCRFGVPHELVSDHGTQFKNEKLQSICDRLGIIKVFSSPAHPKSNGQVEAVNKTIKQTLKKKLEKSKGAWVDKLPLVLWAYRTSFRAATGETPFSLAYGVEAIIPIEISLPTFRVDNFDEENNDVLLALATDLLEEK
ncbi:hypothetical protein UlMin_044785 [Ulmus minor]